MKANANAPTAKASFFISIPHVAPFAAASTDVSRQLQRFAPAAMFTSGVVSLSASSTLPRPNSAA